MTKFKEIGIVTLPDNKDIKDPTIEWKSIVINNDKTVTIELYYYSGNHPNPTLSRSYTKTMPKAAFDTLDDWINGKLKDIHKNATQI